MKTMFIKVKNFALLDSLLQGLKNSGYVMASDFDKNIPDADTLIKCFKSYYHGNSKMMLDLSYNTITGHKELSLCTASVIKSYPQYKDFESWQRFSCPIGIVYAE